MKNLLILPLVFFLFGTASAVELNWNQEISTDFAGWKIYMGTTQGGPYSHVDDVQYSGTLSDTYETEMSIPIVEGQKINYYIVLTAFDTADNESEYSNEVKYSAYDITPPPAPQSLIIKITQQ